MADPIFINDRATSILINEGPDQILVTDAQGGPLSTSLLTQIAVILDQPTQTIVNLREQAPQAIDILVSGDDVVEIHGTGPQGPAGSVTAQGFLIYTQTPASATWTIAHNFGRKPVVSVVDLGGQQILGGVTHLSDNVVQICFETPLAGNAVLL